MALSKLLQQICPWCGQFVACCPDATLALNSFCAFLTPAHKVCSIESFIGLQYPTENLMLQEMKKRLRDEYLGFGGAPNQVGSNEQPQCTFPALHWYCFNVVTAHMT